MLHTCKICLEEFNSQRSVSNHMRKHSDVVYMCNEADCQLVFTSIGDFNTHNNLHKDQLQCPICQRRFYKNSALRTHVLSVHEKQKKFNCKECDKSFFRNRDLTNHEQLHINQSKYNCDVCHKSFSHVSNLNRHKRLHTNEKLYCCNICKKRFTQSSTLQRHKKGHKSELKPKCTMCDQSFFRLNELKSHLVRIHNVHDDNILNEQKKLSRTYYCYNCGEQFEMKIDLSAHKLQCHHETTTTLPNKVEVSSPSGSNQHFTDEEASTSEHKVSNDGITDEYNNYYEHFKEGVGVNKLMEHEKYNTQDIVSKDTAQIKPHENKEPANEAYEIQNYVVDVQGNEVDDNSEMSDYSVSSLESDCVMCEGKQLDDGHKTINKEKVKNFIEKPSNWKYDEIPSPQMTICGHKVTSGDVESIFSASLAQSSSVIKRSVLFQSSTTETSKPVIQGVRSNNSIHQDLSRLPQTNLIHPDKQSVHLERGQPCSVIKLVKVHSTKLAKEGSIVKKEATINNIEAVLQTPISPPKIALSSITSNADELFPTSTFQAYESLPANKRLQLEQRDKSKPVILGILPSSERKLNDNKELINNTTKAKETTNVLNKNHNLISTKSRGITGMKVLRRKRLPPEKKTGEEEPIHEHMSHTHVVQTIRRIVKDLANPNIDDTNEDLTNPNTSNTFEDLANSNEDNNNEEDENENAEDDVADLPTDLNIDDNIEVSKEEVISPTLKDEVIMKPMKKYVCSVCDKGFDKPCYLQFHKGVHDDNLKKFECEICAQRFCYKSRLNYHISTKHSKVHKTFDCSLCDKQFSAPNSLKDHKKRIHCNEKKFLCKKCPKQFYKKHDLKVHTRTHTNMKPYSCKLCDKHFSHISHLYRHEKIHKRKNEK